MTNNPTIDGVSRELLETVVSTCSFTLPEIVYQELRTLLDAPTNDLREHCKQCAEVVKTWPEWKQNCLGGAPAVERQEEVQMASMPIEHCYDVRAKMIIAFNEAKKAGADLDDQLDAAYKAALRFSPAPQDFAALQSTITQLQVRIAELESGLGGMLFAFDDGVGRGWSEKLLDYARKLTPAVEFDATAALNGPAK